MYYLHVPVYMLYLYVKNNTLKLFSYSDWIWKIREDFISGLKNKYKKYIKSKNKNVKRNIPWVKDRLRRLDMQEIGFTRRQLLQIERQQLNK